MECYEITGYPTGISQSGVNFLQPVDSFQNMQNGFIYRQVLQSRKGFTLFSPRLAGNTRVFGIFEHTLPIGTKELLAFDTNFLYRYNVGTGVFDQIAFGGSMAGYAGFNLSSPEYYISGTSYPAAQFLSNGAANPAYTALNQGARFVFTSYGITLNGAGSGVFFYNGTDVQDFTSVIDNPNYAAPPQGTLQRAHYVLWFGERLNFVLPEIASTIYSQGFLYSGIRNASGNGDKYNAPGSGLLQADTYENIMGCTILGNYIALNFDRSNWIIEKTRDAFNPYFIRRVPGVLGTDAEFSSVSWADTVKSMGKTGIIGTDGRQSLRVDNKIPFFTENQINQYLFNNIYGGFNRTYNQFMWSYISNETESATQDKVLIENYEFDTWTTYDMRLSVFGQTDLGIDVVWNDIDETTGNESWKRWDTTEEIWNKIGIGNQTQKTLAGDDMGFIYQIDTDYNDYFIGVNSITNANPCVLTVDESAFKVGDRIAIANVEGMTEINNYDYEDDTVDFTPWIVTSATDTAITINADSTLWGVATADTGSVSKVISFSAETIPFNPYRPIGFRVYVSHVDFLLDTDGGFLKVDVIADEEETPFKQDILIKPTGILKEREWVTMSVNCEAEFMTFRLKQENPSTQVKVTSMRIYAKKGAFTSN